MIWGYHNFWKHSFISQDALQLKTGHRPPPVFVGEAVFFGPKKNHWHLSQLRSEGHVAFPIVLMTFAFLFFFEGSNPITDPWDERYIYLHLVDFLKVNFKCR